MIEKYIFYDQIKVIVKKGNEEYGSKSINLIHYGLIYDDRYLKENNHKYFGDVLNFTQNHLEFPLFNQ